MLISVIGRPCSGIEETIKYFVEEHGFIRIGLEHPATQMSTAQLVSLEAAGKEVEMLIMSACRQGTSMIFCDCPSPRAQPQHRSV